MTLLEEEISEFDSNDDVEDESEVESKDGSEAESEAESMDNSENDTNDEHEAQDMPSHAAQARN